MRVEDVWGSERAYRIPAQYFSTSARQESKLRSLMTAAKPQKWPRIVKRLLHVAAWLFALYVLLNIVLFEDPVHISCEESQPLVQVRSNFLPENLFQVLHQELPTHPLIAGNFLEEGAFNHTHGWVVKFNKDGLHLVKGNPHFEYMLPYLDRVLNPESNAFVFNLLVANQHKDGHEVVERHLDNTVGLRPFREPEHLHLAHQVNVLYTNLPSDIAGGQLVVFPPPYIDFGGLIRIKPNENTMVEFRGDAPHGVEAFTSPSGHPRISLVLEQYKLDEKSYYRTIPYCENDDCNHLLL